MEFFILFLILPFCVSQRQQTVTHYYSDSPRAAKLIYDRATGLNNLAEFPRRITKSCLTGSLVVYGETNTLLDGIFASGVNKCFDWNEYGITPKSYRRIGDNIDYERRYFVPFEHKNFLNGTSVNFLGDNPEIDQVINSYAMMGTNTSVTLYTNTEYQGLSFCIKNNGSQISIADSDFTSTIGFQFTCKSIKFGCDSSNLIK